MSAVRFLKQISRKRDGATAVEFALLTPVLLYCLCGFLEVGYQMYVSGVLQGAVNKAARDATLENAKDRLTAIDDRVKTQVLNINKNATFESDRKSYATFQDAGNPEPFNDDNSNGKRDTNECYQDINGNKTYDLDRGKAGIGGPDDIVMYTMTVTYPHFMPSKLFGWMEANKAKATTVLRNQPYGAQTIPVVVCAK